MNYFGTKSFLEEQLEDPGAKVNYSESYIFTYFLLFPNTTNTPPSPPPPPPLSTPHSFPPPLQHAYRFLPPSQCRLHPMSRLFVCPAVSTLSACLQTSQRGFKSLSTGAGSQSGEWGSCMTHVNIMAIFLSSFLSSSPPPPPSSPSLLLPPPPPPLPLPHSLTVCPVR